LAAAKRLFLLAETVGAEDLLRLGYLDQLVDPSALDATVERFAQSLLAGAPLALQGMKQSLNEVSRGQWQSQAIRERERHCAASQDLTEGLAAFAQRRTAHFKGH
jgi:enoyl-CoA hydratase/carnithine racemase